MNDHHSIHDLVRKHLDDSISAEEREYLLEFINNHPELDWTPHLVSYFEEAEVDENFTRQHWEPVLQSILGNKEKEAIPAPVIPLKKGNHQYWGWVAAACVLAAGAFFFWSSMLRNPSAKSQQAQSHPKEVKPGQDGAVLVLADGTQITLDSLRNGLVANENGAEVLLENGMLNYNRSGEQSNTLTYNTIVTPRGRQFQVALPDDSKVWLNAGSSIRFPTVFQSNERRVYITGEAYFEVAKNREKPFIAVLPDSSEVQVLGTHFNINAYEDDKASYTTLLEGAVRVKLLQDSVVLTPGQQARIKDQTKTVKRVNVDHVVAWKNGYFNFNDASLEQVLNQLSRWYDIEILHPQGLPGIYFVGEIPRNVPLPDVLSFLETTGVHFSIEGRTLVVLP